MNTLLLAPPLAFLILLLAAYGLDRLARLFSAKGTDSLGKGLPYACGQDVPTGRVQPGYGEFFPIAFFFTILHVAALVLSTAPPGSLWLALLYIAVCVLALRILFGRDDYGA